MRKRFDPDLYKKYDMAAKKSTKKLFDNLQDLQYKFKVEENVKKREVDLLVYYNDIHIFNVETEVKRVWKDEFQYDSVQFPERKEKFTKLSVPTLFLMFNEDLSQYLTVNSKILKSSPKEMVRNKYVPYGEYFFKVPLEKIIFNNLHKSILELYKGDKNGK